MKTKVIEFFQNLPAEKHDQFNQAFELYRKCPNKNLAVERSYNSGGFTDRNLENLLYDLQKINEISDVEKAVRLQVADGSEQVAEGSEQVADVSEQDADGRGQDADDSKQDDSEKTIDAKQIRVEFPFLNDKDCPDEFKILVADKITAWNRYLECQAEMVKIESGEVIETDLRKADLAKNAIEAFEENKKIYDELNVYKETGKVLGVHPIFKKLQLSREVELMTNDDLIKYKSASAKYFSDNKKSLAEAKKNNNEVNIKKIEARVAERYDKLFLVNKKLGV